MSFRVAEADGDDRWHRLYARKLEVEAVQAFELFRRNGIEPVLIKGWAAARNYPAHAPRFYSDIDLAVSAEEFDSAQTLLASKEASRIGIDLHRELRHLDSRPWRLIFESSQLIDLDGCAIRIPSPEDHLRILAVHWLNDGGESKDRLWDVYYALAAHAGTFDWDYCLDGLSTVRRGWIIAAVGLANKYLGLPIDGIPFAAEARDLPRWLIAAVEREWSRGVLHRSLHTCLNDPGEFIRQLRKRIPPNAIQATIECEGDIRAGMRLPFQIRCMMKRSIPSIRGVAETIRSKAR
ncbi:MAG: nucleotidyltransferase family protein [Acidobacteria bacterium]|nr:nucleotidyltransferase family protein [Acidobacteriota bacterium]